MGCRNDGRDDDDDTLKKPLLLSDRQTEKPDPDRAANNDGSSAGSCWTADQQRTLLSNPGGVFALISDNCNELFQQTVDCKKEIWSLISIAFPVGASSFLRVLMAITDISVLGRLNDGTKFLAAAGLATVIMDITSTFPSTAADSLNALCSQAVGAHNPKLAGRWLKISLIAAILMCIPVMISWTLVDVFLQALGTSSGISQLARTFALWSAIGLIPNTVYYAVRQYFQSLNVVYPALFNNLIFIFLNLMLNLVFVHGIGPWKGLGFIGSPIATSVSRTLQLIAFVSYTCIYLKLHAANWPDTPFWCCFTKKNLTEYWNQTLPTVVGNATTQWLMQAITLLASQIGVVEVATQSAVYCIFYAFQCLSVGISKACICRVGYYLGAFEPQFAQQAARISTFLSLILGVIVALALILLRNVFGYCFSKDPDVWKSTSDLIPFIAVSYIGLNSVLILSSILYGQGRPKFVAIISACTSWFLSLPLACLFAFSLRAGLPGLWIGLTCGYVTISIISGASIYRSDWEQRSLEAIHRSRSQSCVARAV